MALIKMMCMCTALMPNLYGASIPKLIIISMDGFRFDYLDMLSKEETSNFQKFIENGVTVPYIINVMPSVTYTNHYTLITGLYPESHGIVHNRFYDPKLKENFWFDNRQDNFDPKWYDVGAEPIYVTNKRAGPGRKTGSVLWPSGLGKVKGNGPDRLFPNADPFSYNITFTERVDQLISWFTDKNEPINLGLLYFHEPDETAHKYGAGSDQVKTVIKTQLNICLGYLLQKLTDAHLYNDTNIILTSDHGFTNHNESFVLSEALESSLYKAGSERDGEMLNHDTINIFPIAGKEELVYQSLHNFSVKHPNLFVYSKADSDPSKGLPFLHYNNSERIGPIVITGNEGVLIFKNKEEQNNFTQVGIHGHDPYKVKNMNPFFLAMGPAFKKGYVGKPFESVNIYELMCLLLDIKPAPNNGSAENIKELLRDKSGDEKGFTLTGVSFLVIVGVSMTVAGTFAICACNNIRNKPRFLFHSKNRAFGEPALRSPTHHLLLSDDDEF